MMPDEAGCGNVCDADVRYCQTFRVLPLIDALDELLFRQLADTDSRVTSMTGMPVASLIWRYLYCSVQAYLVTVCSLPGITQWWINVQRCPHRFFVMRPQAGDLQSLDLGVGAG